VDEKKPKPSLSINVEEKQNIISVILIKTKGLSRGTDG